MTHAPSPEEHDQHPSSSSSSLLKDRRFKLSRLVVRSSSFSSLTEVLIDNAGHVIGVGELVGLTVRVGWHLTSVGDVDDEG